MDGARCGTRGFLFVDVILDAAGPGKARGGNMGKMIRILLTIVAGVLVFEAAILKFIIPQEPEWTEFRGEGFVCRVPESTHDSWEGDGWHKNRFRGKTGELYVSHRLREGDAMPAIRSFERFLKPVYETELPVLGPGKFFLETYGKARRYVYIFSVGQRLFWVENGARGSTLRFYKDVLDRVVESLVVDGKGVSPEFRARTAAVNREILWYSQSVVLLAGFMAGLPIVIIGLVAVPVLAFVGRLPRFSSEHPVRSAENLFAWARHPMGFQGTLVAMALFQDRLEVYSWRRSFIVVTREEGSVSRVPGKEKIVISRGNRRVTVDVEHPIRWLDEIAGRGIPLR